MAKEKRKKPNTSADNQKVVRHKKPIAMHIGLVIFAIIFIYAVYSVGSSLGKEVHATYRVGLPESVTTATTYNAMILREETVVNSDWSGYLDLFLQEGTHVSVGTLIASVDELGIYSEQIRDSQSTHELSTENLMRLRERLIALTASYDGRNFSSVYTSKQEMESYFLSYGSQIALDELNNGSSFQEFFHQKKAENSGLVVYYRDGYENTTVMQLTAKDFNRADYMRESVESTVTPGSFLYKLITSEKWSLIVPITAEQVAEYMPQQSLRVTFLSNDLTANCTCHVLTGADGNFYLSLGLDQYMIQFVAERYVKIRLDQAAPSGYKIPKTSVLSKDFFLIPVSFGAQAEGTNTISFTRVNYGEGADETEGDRVTPTIFYNDGSYYYVDQSAFAEGTVLAKSDSTERYTVRLTGALNGVYQVNRGYTIFRHVRILDESADYYIVDTNTAYGITTYDNILIDPTGVSEGQVLDKK